MTLRGVDSLIFGIGEVLDSTQPVKIVHTFVLHETGQGLFMQSSCRHRLSRHQSASSRRRMSRIRLIANPKRQKKILSEKTKPGSAHGADFRADNYQLAAKTGQARGCPSA